MKLIESAKLHTNRQFIDDVQKIHRDENGVPLYDYSKTEYIGSKFPVKVICKRCGSEFIVRASHHKYGVGCKKCSDKRLAELRRSNTNEFIEKSKLIHKDKYDYSEVNYVDNITPVKLHCNICNFNFPQIPQYHLNGNGCPKCARKLHSSRMISNKDEFIKKSKLIHKNDKGLPLYDYSKVEYKGYKIPVTIICKKCGKNFEQKPKHHLYGCGCKHCNKSRGEKYIENQLKLNKINFDPQKRFDDCRNKIQLPFDFYLPNYDICIEFDGTHHYQIKNGLGGFDRLVKQKENDRIKTNYCQNKGIKLFRIKYTDNLKESVQDILDYIKNQFKNEI